MVVSASSRVRIHVPWLAGRAIGEATPPIVEIARLAAARPILATWRLLPAVGPWSSRRAFAFKLRLAHQPFDNDLPAYPRLDGADAFVLALTRGSARLLRIGAAPGRLPTPRAFAIVGPPHGATALGRSGRTLARRILVAPPARGALVAGAERPLVSVTARALTVSLAAGPAGALRPLPLLPASR